MPRTVTLIRWTARICALAVVAFVLIFLIGEGPPNPLKSSARENLLLVAFAVLILGQLIGWFSEPWGAGMILGGFAAFYLVNLIATGHWPRGPYFILVALPGVLYALSFLLVRRTAVPPDGPSAPDEKPSENPVKRTNKPVTSVV